MNWFENAGEKGCVISEKPEWRWGGGQLVIGGLTERLAMPGAPEAGRGVSICLGMNRLWFILRQSRNPNSRAKTKNEFQPIVCLLLQLTFMGLVTVVGALTPGKRNNFWLSIYEEFSDRLWNWSLQQFCKRGIISQLG